MFIMTVRCEQQQQGRRGIYRGEMSAPAPSPGSGRVHVSAENTEQLTCTCCSVVLPDVGKLLSAWKQSLTGSTWGSPCRSRRSRTRSPLKNTAKYWKMDTEIRWSETMQEGWMAVTGSVGGRERKHGLVSLCGQSFRVRLCAFAAFALMLATLCDKLQRP